jgi:hypothetical protein
MMGKSPAAAPRALDTTLGSAAALRTSLLAATETGARFFAGCRFWRRRTDVDLRAVFRIGVSN